VLWVWHVLDANGRPITLGARSLSFHDCIAVYDFCVFPVSFQEHLLHIRAVLTRLRERKLYVKPTKCKWSQREIDSFHHCVSSIGLSIPHAKAEALQSWPAPSSVAVVRSLLGTFEFRRKYIHLDAIIVEPIVALARKAIPSG
jgi:hypothetical protein